MHYRQLPSFSTIPPQSHKNQFTHPNPNTTLSWSSINSNQQSTSPYKLSNPSSPFNHSLSHIQQDHIETTRSIGLSQIIKPTSKNTLPPTTYQNQKNFYQYLLDQNQTHQSSQIILKNQLPTSNIYLQQNPHLNYPNQQFPNKNKPINYEHRYEILDTKRKNFTLINQHSGYSPEQSLMHLEQSQQELSFLKFKLQQAYDKLQKEIINSYQLQQKIQHLKAQLQGKDQLLELEKAQNQKLKFTLKAIMKNKSFLQEQMEKGEPKKCPQSEYDRQKELKENLKLKLEIKQLRNKVKFYEDSAKSYQSKTQKPCHNQENKENCQSNNNKQEFTKSQKDEAITIETKSVGKWKKSRSQSNNSSLQIEPISNQQFGEHQADKSLVMEKTFSELPLDPVNKVSNENQATGPTAIDTEDQKLSKYQQHRKRIESQLWGLEKIKRPTAEERQKMQKLQKQLYYLDSDIAGLKRKIRRKY